MATVHSDGPFGVFGIAQGLGRGRDRHHSFAAHLAFLGRESRDEFADNELDESFERRMRLLGSAKAGLGEEPSAIPRESGEPVRRGPSSRSRGP